MACVGGSGQEWVGLREWMVCGDQEVKTRRKKTYPCATDITVTSNTTRGVQTMACVGGSRQEWVGLQEWMMCGDQVEKKKWKDKNISYMSDITITGNTTRGVETMACVGGSGQELVGLQEWMVC